MFFCFPKYENGNVCELTSEDFELDEGIRPEQTLAIL